MAYEGGFVNDGIPDFVKEAEEMMARGEMITPPAAEEITIKFGKGLVSEPFTSKAGKELVEVKIPNPDPADKRPWESFVISPKMIHDNQFGKGVWMKVAEDATFTVSRPVRTGLDESGKGIWGKESRQVSSTELKGMLEAYKDRDKGSVLSDLSAKKLTAMLPRHLSPRRNRTSQGKEEVWQNSSTPARNI